MDPWLPIDVPKPAFHSLIAAINAGPAGLLFAALTPGRLPALGGVFV